MKIRRRMLIVVALVAIMLLNCFAPIMQVQAATEKTTMTFNTALYKAIRSYFEEVGVKAVYNDVKHTIKMETSAVNEIKELSLKEKGIRDITDLDSFPNVERLILSANSLSEDSNLGILNNFPNLKYLDISSNKITDVSEIEALLIDLIKKDPESVNISSQTGIIVTDVQINSAEQSKTLTYKLPQILQFLGMAQADSNEPIKYKGEWKSDWINRTYSSSIRNMVKAPNVVSGSIPNPVTVNNNEFSIEVGQASRENGYDPLEGLIEMSIYINDSSTGGYNSNPAGKNMLNQSVFNLYYVVHVDDTEGVIFKDKNLYNAVKTQLTKNQTMNTELLSYPYSLTTEDSILYDICDYVLDADGKGTLSANGEDLYYIYDMESGEGSVYDIKRSMFIDVRYEFVNVESVSPTGEITLKRKIKVPHLNADCRNLYIDAYDKPMALVISDLDIINKIPSLILNDQKIVDLSGLEKFIGLESSLNVSYNLIETLAQIYALEINKNNNNPNLQQAFKDRKDAMASTKDKILTGYDNVITIKGEIADQMQNIKDKFTEIDTIREVTDLSDEDAANRAEEAIENKKKEIMEIVYLINGKPAMGDDEATVGLVDYLTAALEDTKDGLNPNFEKMYTRFKNMYIAFNKEYKLTTLLIPELNYETEAAYEDFLAKSDDRTAAKNLVKNQVQRIGVLERNDALSVLEQQLIIRAFSLSLSSRSEFPISEALNDLVTENEEDNDKLFTWTNMNDKFIEVAQYSEAVNYCYLERLNSNVATEECLVKEYFNRKIKDYSYEGIDTTLLDSIYNKLLGKNSANHNAALYEIFDNYIADKITCNKVGNESEILDKYKCEGPATEVKGFNYKISNSERDGITYPSQIELYEIVSGNYENHDNLFFYNQLMNIANKFTSNDEISIYVKLPNLKSVDIRNNKLETLGDVRVTMINEDGTLSTTIENLASLENLKEFYAGHNFVTGDIECVDWSKLTRLKSLDLSYNYIEDILPLQNLDNIRYLDVSDNLLEGSFNLSLISMKKLKDLKLAGNKYDDIRKILVEYEMISEGNLSAYFARNDTLNIDLSRQELEITIPDDIPYDPSTKVYEVELPPIFAQLEHIDGTRTAFGTTSSKGTIEANGEYAYVPIREEGDYQGLVTVIAANGYPEDVTTSFGIGTSCKINYSVKKIEVTDVVINEEITEVERGTEVQFTATVNGTNIPDTSVEWELIGAESENTTLTQEGLLTVAVDETADNLQILATSNYDDTKEASKDITLFTKVVTDVEINEVDTKIEKGKSATFTATVTGEYLEDEDKGVIWSIEAPEIPGEDGADPIPGTLSADTSVDENGVLTVGVDETSDFIQLTATSMYDNTKSHTINVPLFVKSVTNVTVQSGDTVKPGTKLSFTATVTGDYLEDKDKGVTWSLFGNTTPYTVINPETGELTISADEEAEKLTVIATSKYDISKMGTADVNMIVVRSVTVESASDTVINGGSLQLTAKVEGSNLIDDDKGVIWSIYASAPSGIMLSEETEISEDGILTVAESELATEIVITATSKEKESIKGSKTIKVDIPLPEFENYEIDPNDANFIIGISPETTSSRFISRLFDDEDYKVEVKREGAIVDESEFIATGDLVIVYYGDERVVDIFEAVVKGDVDGDGLANRFDTSLIKCERLYHNKLTGAFLRAADIDNSGDITVSDVKLLFYHRAKMPGYIL